MKKVLFLLLVAFFAMSYTAQAQCTLTFELNEEVGVGWENDTLVVSYIPNNATSAITEYFTQSGYQTSYDRVIKDGTEMNISLIGVGSYDVIKKSFKVKYANGKILYSSPSLYQNYSKVINGGSWACADQDNPYVTLSLTSNIPAAANTLSSDPVGPYEPSTNVTLHAVANEGYLFENWSYDGVVVSTLPEYEFELESNSVYVASFKKLDGDYIGDGDINSNKFLPTYSTYNFSVSQQIYTMDSIDNVKAGMIKGLSFFNDNVNSEKYRHYKIYLDTTSKTSFTDNYDWIPVDTNNLVFNDSLAMPYGKWSTFNFSNNFNLCDGKNLVVTVYDCTNQPNNQTYHLCRVFNANNEQSIYYYKSSSFWNNLSTSKGKRLSVKNQIVLDYYTESYTINVSANPSEGGTVSGGGVIHAGDMCTVVATPYIDDDDDEYSYKFLNWTENGDVVSWDSLYVFPANRDRDLVANFYTKHWHNELISSDDAMPVDALITVDGQAQSFDAVKYLELAAFTNGVCLGSTFINSNLPAFLGLDYLYMLSVYKPSNSSAPITFALYDHLTGDSLSYQCSNVITYNEDGYGSIINPYEIAFQSKYTVTITTSPDGAGTVTGAGDYFSGQIATLRAYSDVEGYRFKNWIIDDTIYTDNPHNLTVIHNYNVVAEYDIVHKETLKKNWTWWSTYIEMEGVNGLKMLEDALSSNIDSVQPGDKIMVKNKYSEYVGGGIWIRNNLTSINNETCYKIHVSGQSDVEMYGNIANPESHPITIKASVWSWIGYPVSATQNVSALLGAIDAENGDQIVGQKGYAEYYSGMWIQSVSSFKLVPGKGYKYQSHASNDKVLHYSAVSGKGEEEYEEEAAHYWVSNPYAYPDVMCITAVVNVEDVEQENSSMEVGAFVNGECRGSAHLQYIDVTNRYYAMLTVAGENGDIVEFGLVDKEHNLINREGLTRVVFSDDVVLGGIGAPYEVDFGAMEEINGGDLVVYPNPVERGELFTISIPTNEMIKEIVVTNAMGAVVKRSQTTLNMVERGLPVSGVYMVKTVCESGNVYYGKLIVQ